ncbi:MAG: hypothetical protein AAGD32_12220 [Planctomycetota bacterium]
MKIAVVGLGPIGVAAAKAVVADPGMELVELVDVAPAVVGTLPVEDGPVVVEELSGDADVAILCTTSYFDAIAPLVRKCIQQKTHVISSCEEMLWPKYRHAELAAEIDKEAEAAGVSLLGTGVNPGFVLDYFPAVVSSMVLEVSAVTAVRRVKAESRREPLQRKVGATMTVGEFNGLKAQGKIGHKGMAESVCLLAAALGKTIPAGAVVETLEPLTTDKPLDSALGMIEPGKVRGMHNTGGWEGDGLKLFLDLIMAVGEPESFDSVDVQGPVPMKVRVETGTPGDSATVAALVNGCRVLPRSGPGLRTMLDVGGVLAARV